MDDEDEPIPDDELIALTSRSAGEALRDAWKTACVQCLHINEPTTQICQKCNAPMSHITVYGPLERIYTYGLAFRNMVDGQSRTNVLISAWIMFSDAWLMPLLLIGWLISTLQGQGPPVGVRFPAAGDPTSVERNGIAPHKVVNGASK